MNKLKKIGLTALGTTLVASSAFAGEISVSGDAGYTWSSESVGGAAATNATGTATNDGIGYNHDITLSGSGELDNGFTVSTSMILKFLVLPRLRILRVWLMRNPCAYARATTRVWLQKANKP